MRETLGRAQHFLAKHPRFVATLFVVAVFLAASGGAAAMDGTAGFDGVTLGDVDTSESGSSYSGPTGS
jgi:hypothetical protein